MIERNNKRVNKPSVSRLQGKHALLCSEINLLNEELHILKSIIREKQKDLRKINIELIHKATRGPFLHIVKTPTDLLSPLDNIQHSQVLTGLKETLVCIQGGKQP